MNSMKAVIFDMDGLLIDSERIINRALIYAGEQMGLENMKTVSLLTLGASRPRRVEIYREHYGSSFDVELFERLKHSYIDNVLPDGYFPPKEGIYEAIDKLTEHGFRLAVASSSREGWVKPSLEYVNVLHRFEALICGDMVSKSKPDPEIFLTAAAALNISPRECYVLEDSFNGIRAAHRAGMKPVMIPDLVPPDEEMRSLADHICENIIHAAEYIVRTQ